MSFHHQKQRKFLLNVSVKGFILRANLSDNIFKYFPCKICSYNTSSSSNYSISNVFYNYYVTCGFCITLAICVFVPLTEGRTVLVHFDSLSNGLCPCKVSALVSCQMLCCVPSVCLILSYIDSTLSFQVSALPVLVITCQTDCCLRP